MVIMSNEGVLKSNQLCAPRERVTGTEATHRQQEAVGLKL